MRAAPATSSGLPGPDRNRFIQKESPSYRAALGSGPSLRIRFTVTLIEGSRTDSPCRLGLHIHRQIRLQLGPDRKYVLQVEHSQSLAGPLLGLLVGVLAKLARHVWP